MCLVFYSSFSDVDADGIPFPKPVMPAHLLACNPTATPVALAVSRGGPCFSERLVVCLLLMMPCHIHVTDTHRVCVLIGMLLDYTLTC